MSPFGEYLEKLRRSRGLQQKQLAGLIGVNPCYVSAIERGRKGPPSKEVLQQLIESLQLTQLEQKALWKNVELSDTNFRLPPNMSRSEHELVYELRTHLGSITDEQAQMIQMVLRFPSTLNVEAKNEVIGM